MKAKTVAVVTSTIGRPELIRTIESVKAQTYPCKHYIFVDGEQFHDKVREMVKAYPDLVVTYLPMNTGANGWRNAFVNAAASFLIKEDIICYLDDDNWYDPEHTESIAYAFNRYNVDMAFNLRRFCDIDGDFLCDDNTESLGFWSCNKGLDYKLTYGDRTVNMHVEFNRKNGHLDVNCFAFSNTAARQIAAKWVEEFYVNDYNVLKGFYELDLPAMCTGKRTVNYIFNAEIYIDVNNAMGFLDAPEEALYDIQKQTLVNINLAVQNDEKPWLTPTIFYQNNVTLVE